MPSKRKEWEDFRATGRLSGDTRQEIRDSWLRSARMARLNVKRAPGIDEYQLTALDGQVRRLLASARPAMIKAGHLLKQSGNMILISDAQGVVLEQTGDPATLDMGRENNLYRGGRWAEDDVGTNAIGMALRTGLPVQVIGAEHYSCLLYTSPSPRD